MNTINKKLKVLSLFDGISCARVAIERAGFKIEEYYASEIDKYAMQIAQKNYPDIIQLGDIKNIKGKDYEDIDLIIGGSPCQDLSIAKKNREGLKGNRSGLFYEFLRLVKEIKPKYFILENVNSMPKEARETITKELFGIEPTMINAALVSAQNRKRLFWVGKLINGKYKKVEILQPKDSGILLKDILELKVDENFYVKDKSNTVRTSGRGSGINDKHNWDTIKIGKFNSGGQGDRSYSVNGKSVNFFENGGEREANTRLYHIPHGFKKEKFSKEKKYPTLHAQNPESNHLICISSKQKHATILENKSTPLVSAMGMGGGHIPMICKAPNGKIIENTNGIHQFKEIRTEIGKIKRSEYKKLTGLDSSKRGKEDKKYIPQNSGKSNCITTGLGVEGLISKNYQLRKLTPIECERLQSLSDNYTEGVSNTQRYKALGNGFNVEVIKHILKHLK